MTPNSFVQKHLGQSNDYDGAYGVQCVDAFKRFCSEAGIPVKATPNNCADGYWYYKTDIGYDKYFDSITDSNEFRNGDWVIWPRGCQSHPSSHIAMMYNGQEFSENQDGKNGPYSLKNTVFSDACGALRWKSWGVIPVGGSTFWISNRFYTIYRQCADEEVMVVSPGLNQTAKIRDLDVDRTVMAKVMGCNYFQMREDIPDQPYGTTFGPISSPVNGVYQTLPNQDTTLYYDVETGAYADCTGVMIDASHNVFSPAIVYPAEGNYQYARMVGVSAVNISSIYSFFIC